MEQFSDTAIVEHLQSGISKKQELAFRFLYRQYFGLVESMIVRNSGTKEDVADVFQDSLIVLFNNIRKNTFHQNSSLKTYLFAVSKNLWLMRLRKTKREVSLEDQHQAGQIQEDHLDTLVMDEKKKMLFDLLQELGKDCRMILELFYFRKLKMLEIKTQLNLASEQVAKNKKSKCMKSLRSIAHQNTLYKETLK